MDQQTAPPASERLPPEIWADIFLRAGALSVPHGGRPSIHGKPNLTRLSIVLVSRAWHTMGLAPLYECVVLSRKVSRDKARGCDVCTLTDHSARFLALVKEHPERGEWLRRLYVRGPGYSFPNLQDSAAQDIAVIVSVATRLKLLSVYYHSAPSSCTRTILDGLVASHASFLNALHVDTNVDVNDLLHILEQCPSIEHLTISQTHGSLNEMDIPKLSLPRLRSLSIGSEDVWEVLDIPNRHLFAFSFAEMPRLTHMDVVLEEGQLHQLEPFLLAKGAQVRSTYITEGLSSRNQAIEEYLDLLPNICRVSMSATALYRLTPFHPERVPFPHLTDVVLVVSDHTSLPVSQFGEPKPFAFEAVRSGRTLRVESYARLSAFDAFFGALLGPRLSAVARLMVTGEKVIKSQDEGIQMVDDWWAQWHEILENEGILVKMAYADDEGFQ